MRLAVPSRKMKKFKEKNLWNDIDFQKVKQRINKITQKLEEVQSKFEPQEDKFNSIPQEFNQSDRIEKSNRP